MIEQPPTSSPNQRKRIVWIAAILCGACCAAPLIALAFSSTAFTAAAFYLEGAAIIGVVAMLILGLLYLRRTRRQSMMCDIDCGCRPLEGVGTGAKKG